MEALSISVVDSAPRIYAYVRRLATLSSVPAVAASTPLWTKVLHLGLKSYSTPMVIFRDGASDSLLADEEVTVEFGAELAEAFPGDPTLGCAETAAGRTATARFTGHYERLPDVHRAIRAWCAERGERLAGPVWEVFRWNYDPALLETDVYYLLG